MKNPVDRLFVLYGLIIMMLAGLLFATIFGSVETPCEYSGWQVFLILVWELGCPSERLGFSFQGVELKTSPSAVALVRCQISGD